MQSAYPYNTSAPIGASADKKPKYRAKIFVIFFIWFLLAALIPFVNTAPTGPIFNFQEAKNFFKSSPDTVAITGWVVRFALPALIALALLVFCFALRDKSLGILLCVIGIGCWLLFALGPIIALIFGEAPSTFYPTMSKATGSAIWKQSIGFWIGMLLIFHAIVIVFAIAARNRAGKGGGLVMLKSVLAIPLIFFLPIIPAGAGYISLWTRYMQSGLSLVPLLMALLPLALVLTAIFALIGCGKKRFPSKIAAGLLFIYIFMPLWDRIINLSGKNLAALPTKQLPREILGQLLDIVKAAYSNQWLSAPGFLMPAMFLTGAGVFLFVTGKARPAVAFAPTAAYTPRAQVAPAAPAPRVAPVAPVAPLATPRAPIETVNPVAPPEPAPTPKLENEASDEPDSDKTQEDGESDDKSFY